MPGTTESPHAMVIDFMQGWPYDMNAIKDKCPSIFSWAVSTWWPSPSKRSSFEFTLPSTVNHLEWNPFWPRSPTCVILNLHSLAAGHVVNFSIPAIIRSAPASARLYRTPTGPPSPVELLLMRKVSLKLWLFSRFSYSYWGALKLNWSWLPETVFVSSFLWGG